MMHRISLAVLLAGAALAVSRHPAPAAEPSVLAPAPALDAPLAQSHGTETAILSGGCFWGMQAVFQHVKGVTQVVSGYTGGVAGTAHYDDVSTGTTGHAESVKIVFDPSVVSYGTLLRVFVSVGTNPTELDRQGPDEGTQYRSEIWAGTPEQQRVADAYLQQLTTAHIFPAPIVTRVAPAMPFYPAEAYHQNYATLHPDSLYIATFDAPKVDGLKRLFPDLYQSQPVLVRVAATGEKQDEQH
jgi:peptide-methionine (S)-S-oxide reductase